MNNNHRGQALSTAGLLIALGIIYGDIGTSPLYVMKAIIGQQAIDQTLVYGGISCIFWTLTLQTTVKYVLLTLQADNHGEGGILSLYALVRRRWKWLIIPAMVGGSTLLADGIITPPFRFLRPSKACRSCTHGSPPCRSFWRSSRCSSCSSDLVPESWAGCLGR